MTRRKSPPWIYPDRTVRHDDGVMEHWILYGFEGPGGLFPIGTFHLPEDRKRIIEEKRKLAKGKQHD